MGTWNVSIILLHTLKFFMKFKNKTFHWEIFPYITLPFQTTASRKHPNLTLHIVLRPIMILPSKQCAIFSTRFNLLRLHATCINFLFKLPEEKGLIWAMNKFGGLTRWCSKFHHWVWTQVCLGHVRNETFTTPLSLFVVR